MIEQTALTHGEEKKKNAINGEERETKICTIQWTVIMFVVSSMSLGDNSTDEPVPKFIEEEEEQEVFPYRMMMMIISYLFMQTLNTHKYTTQWNTHSERFSNTPEWKEWQKNSLERSTFHNNEKRFM